ncbi:hypothetical protein BZG02_15865 [Labilibaculum filiforme]|uniref:Carboxypeptidase-like regulatory domain-containing protein n=1 Tax=Labilibaculum filiforme TaxID=1940526 RepID=A0A2N3HTP6_9BACT|nr:DUF5686 and carboxypeptidase-like regulatory domain-containing protein [Labilibaculum filiforme]PKQ61428.1 hypothetical protein BZG02_15865 [Labilibaculum filiforme]
MLYRITISVLLTLFSSGLFAQELSGYVKDKDSKEAIPFANVWFQGTTLGTTSDLNGFFRISSSKTDTLCVSSVGYKSEKISIKKSGYQIEVLLENDVMQLSEVKVKPKVPRAKVLFDLIQEHKKENRQQIQSVSNYKSVENTTVYIAIDTASKVNRFISDINEVTLESDDKSIRFSPIYLAEKAMSYTTDSSSVAFKKRDGIFPNLNQAIESMILNNVVVDLDFYKDQINILDRGFISPLSNSAMLYYHLYYNDSTIVNNIKYYSFSFAPKNPYNPLFSGHFTIEDGSFALTEIEANIPQEANLNFVNGFKGKVNYKKRNEGGWFYEEQEVGLNMSLRINKDSLSNYSSKRMENVSSGNWLISKTTRYSTAERLNEVKASVWKNQAEFIANDIEEENYDRVGKLKQERAVKGVDAIGGIVLSSYMKAGKFDIGPVFSIYTTNTVEGTRITAPIRTNERMWERFSVGGFLGVGTKSKELKYGLNLIYQPQKSDQFIMRFNYSDDYNLVSQDKYLRFIKNNPNIKGNSNFIGSFTTREKNPYIKEEKSVDMRFEYHTKSDMHFEFSPYFLSSTTTPDVTFHRNGLTYNRYQNYGVLMNYKLTFHQNFDKYYFDRVYYMNPIPIVNLSVDMGKTSISGNDDDFGSYVQFNGSIQGRIVMGQVFMNYMVNGGYLLGDAPFDLLDMPVGSMSLGYAKYRFNLLHHASFAHNLYTNTHLHINGGGIILNRIPLVKKLKLREIVSLKIHHGKLNHSYKGVFDLPDYYENNKKSPYGEIGFGLANIFKILRVEYVRQLGGKFEGSDFTDRNGIFFRAEMSF